MYDARVDFWEKWREFLDGGKDIWVFLQKGKHPHQAGQAAEQAAGQAAEQTEGRAEQTEGRAEQTEGRAEQSRTKQSRAGPSRAEQEGSTRQKSKRSASLHLFSIGNYFHRALFCPIKIANQK